MGGFDSYAFQIRVDMGLAPLDRSTLDRLQFALAAAVPAWSSRARLSTLGRWRIGEAFDAATPGSLDAVIQAHRPGGPRAKPTVGLEQWASSEMELRLTGADRGASIQITYIGSPRSGEPASIATLLVETTQREIDGEAAGTWIERIFRALCADLAPPRATASSLGERMSASRRGVASGIEWLTYFGPEGRTISLERLHEIPGVDAVALSGGVLIRLDPSPGPRRYVTYWRRVRAVEAAIGPHQALNRPRSARPPQTSRPAEKVAVPIPFVPRPIVTTLGTTHVQGARYERTRFAQLGLHEPGAIVEGFDLVRCEFDNVQIGSYYDGEEPVFVRNGSLTRCRSSVVLFGLVVVEDCVIDGHAGGFWATAAIFLKHVLMRGPIDALDLRSPRQLRDPQRPSLPQIHDHFYRSVDWALDIREARFKRCDVGGVPAHLVRRDPATQILITRERALAGAWREVTADHFWRIGIEDLVDSGEESEVFVACPRGGRFEQELALISRLREAGIAEPD